MSWTTLKSRSIPTKHPDACARVRISHAVLPATMLVPMTASRADSGTTNKLLAFAGSRFEYLQLLKDTTTFDPERFTKHSADTVTAICSQIQIMKKVTPEIATELLKMLNRSVIMEPHKEILQAANSNKVELDVCAATTVTNPNEQKKHTNNFFHEYVQRGHELQDLAETVDLELTTRMLAKLARVCGMNHPTEHTFAKMLACGFSRALKSQIDTMSMQGDLGYNMLQKLKQHFRNMPQLTDDGPEVYPPFAELEAKHPNLFRNAGFEPNANNPNIDKALWPGIIQLGHLVPRRSSRATVHIYFRVCFAFVCLYVIVSLVSVYNSYLRVHPAAFAAFAFRPITHHID